MDDRFERKYSVDELQELRNFLVANINNCAINITRDDAGIIIVSDELDKEIRDSINNMANHYSRLGGYIPPLKNALCSPVLEWMKIGGYTYPYTMEMTGNKYNDKMFYPLLYAHEASHHLGYYKENDAEFLSDLICMNSDEWLIKYSGFYYAYCYVDNDYWTSLLNSFDGDKVKAKEIYIQQLHPLKQVSLDRAVFKNATQVEYQKDVSQKIEQTFQAKAESVADVGWSTQATILKDAVYSGVVKLLLQYYDGILY